MGSNNQFKSMEIEVIWEKSTTKSKTQIFDKAKAEEENTVPSIGVKNCDKQRPLLKFRGKRSKIFQWLVRKMDN